jgi:hypothetical protein
VKSGVSSSAWIRLSSSGDRAANDGTTTKAGVRAARMAAARHFLTPVSQGAGAVGPASTVGATAKLNRNYANEKPSH